MLKPEKRHSQTLSTKKPKPIEITLTKKQQNTNSSQNYGQENLNQSVEKGHSTGLSLVRPLKQKSLNLSESHTLNLKQLKSQQLKLKQEVCPSYKINWGTTPISNSSRISQISASLMPQENIARQLNHMLKTGDYKKYAKEVQDTYASNTSQFVTNFTNFPNSFDSKKDEQSIMNRQIKQVSSMNSVKSKIKGLAKGFLRESKHVNQNIENHDQKGDLMLKEILQIDKSQSSIIQQQSATFYSQSLLQSQHEVLPQRKEPQSPQNLILIQENLTERSALKQHYAVLSQRLQQCVQQIVEIEKNNSVQKIVELENQILMIKECHEGQKIMMQNRIVELQQKLALKQSQNHIIDKKSVDNSIQTDFHQQIQSESQTIINTYKAQAQHLNQKVTQLTQLLHPQPFQNDQPSIHPTRSSLQLQNQLYDMDIIKRKYTTLEQVLESKKKQIANKDAIIQVLLTKQVQNRILQKETLSYGCSQKDKVRQLVFQMFGYMNGKLTNL